MDYYSISYTMLLSKALKCESQLVIVSLLTQNDRITHVFFVLVTPLFLGSIHGADLNLKSITLHIICAKYTP